MPAGYLPKDLDIWLAAGSTLVHLSAGSGSIALTGTATSVAVQGLSQGATLRQATQLDHACTVDALWDPDMQASLNTMLSGTTAQHLFVINTLDSDKTTIAGPVQTDSLSLTAPYNDLVLAQGNIPAAGAWSLGQAKAVTVTGASTAHTVTAPGTTFTRAWLLITRYDAALTVTATFAGDAVTASTSALVDAGTVTGNSASLSVTAVAGSGSMTGYIVSGTPIAIT